jgi:hypothetical protein
MGEVTNAYKILVTKPEGSGKLGRPRHRWRMILKCILKKMCWESVNWIDLAEDREK